MYNVVPFNDTRRLFTITDLNNKPVLYERPKELRKPYYFEQFNLCFTGSSDAVKNMKVYDIPSIFTKPYIILNTNCPLFAWLPYNNNTYQALIRLGILEDRPWNQLILPSMDIMCFLMSCEIISFSIMILWTESIEERKTFEMGIVSAFIWEWVIRNLISKKREHLFMKMIFSRLYNAQLLMRMLVFQYLYPQIQVMPKKS